MVLLVTRASDVAVLEVSPIVVEKGVKRLRREDMDWIKLAQKKYIGGLLHKCDIETAFTLMTETEGSSESLVTTYKALYHHVIIVKTIIRVLLS
jgi:DNA polymerase elongation subunit (family B)